MTKTVKAILGCLAALLVLGGLVTFYETRLPMELSAKAGKEEANIRSDLFELYGMAKDLSDALEAHGDLLNETAQEERWGEILTQALREVQEVERRHQDELAPLIRWDDGSDAEEVAQLLDELTAKRESAIQSAYPLQARFKAMFEIVPGAVRAYQALGKRIADEQVLVRDLEQAIADLARREPRVEPVLIREGWRDQLVGFSAALDLIAEKRARLEPKADELTVAAAKELFPATELLEAERAQAVARLPLISQAFKALETFLEKRASYGPQVEADLAALSRLPFQETAAPAKRALERYPFNAVEIERRTLPFVDFEPSARRAAEVVRQELRKPLQDVDPALVLRNVMLVESRRSMAAATVKAFAAQVAELDQSRERVMVDMEVVIDSRITYRQEFMTVAASMGRDEVKSERSWTVVTEADYKRLEDRLGLTMSYKPFGYFSDQTERAHPIPAGMAYVGNTAYGEWSGETWAFHRDPRTTALVDLAWRGHYPNHTRDQALSCERREGAWRGTDRWGHPLYGTWGSLTKTIYGGSRWAIARGREAELYRKEQEAKRAADARAKVFVGGSRSSGSSRGSRRTSYGK